MSEILKFEFSINEINAILNALGQQPYAQVAELINTIRVQAAPQMNQLESVK